MYHKKHKPRLWDVHHTFPSSTFPEYKHEKWNHRQTRRSHHQAWHMLVGNQSPLGGLIQLFNEFTPYDKHYLLDDPALDEFIAIAEQLRDMRNRGCMK